MKKNRETRDSETGTFWEEFACRHLRARGLKPLQSRYRCRLGEIDLVLLDRDELVFVEVRARSRGAYVRALESIDRHKRERLVKTARHYLMCHPDKAAWPIRFDVVAIDGIDTDQPHVQWLRNAFDGT